jgi:hypothetical protein
VKIIKGIGLGIKEMNVVIYEGSAAVVPGVKLRFNIEKIFTVDYGTVKIVLNNQFHRRLIFAIKCDPPFKIVQMLCQDGNIGGFHFMKVAILCKIHGIVIELSVIGIILEASRGVPFAVGVLSNGITHRIVWVAAGNKDKANQNQKHQVS